MTEPKENMKARDNNKITFTNSIGHSWKYIVYVRKI